MRPFSSFLTSLQDVMFFSGKNFLKCLNWWVKKLGFFALTVITSKRSRQSSPTMKDMPELTR